MAVFFLIRHASCDGLGHQINGRTPGIHLNKKGKQEAALLANRLAGLPISSVFSSPLERTEETAQAIANILQVSFHADEALNEIDYGNWTGKTFEELRDDSGWRHFNQCRCSAQIPGGESMPQLRQRAGEAIDRFCASSADAPVALVSHADWIRAAVSQHTGISLDVLAKFQLDPASVTVMRLQDSGSTILRWNDTGPLKSIL